MTIKAVLFDIGGAVELRAVALGEGDGVVEYDKSGKIVWNIGRNEITDNPLYLASSVERLANGNTLYARTWAAEGEPAVVEVDRAGSVLWSWSGEEAFGSNALFAGYRDEQDAWMHPTVVPSSRRCTAAES